MDAILLLCARVGMGMGHNESRPYTQKKLVLVDDPLISNRRICDRLDSRCAQTTSCTAVCMYCMYSGDEIKVVVVEEMEGRG